MPATSSSGGVPASLLVLTAVSILFGISNHVVGAWLGPFSFLKKAELLSTLELRQKVLGAGWGHGEVFTAKSFGIDSYSLPGKAIDEFARLIFIILWFFRDMIDSRLAKGLLLLMASAFTPLLTFICTEPLRPSRNAFVGITYVVAVLSIGQLIMFGAALPIFYIPYYVRLRVSEARTVLSGIHPQHPPSKFALGLSVLCNGFVSTAVALLVLVPSTSAHHLKVNLFFQAFPLFLLPLAFSGFLNSCFGGNGMQTKTRPQNLLIDGYALLSFITVILRVTGVALLWPSLQPLGQGLLTFAQALPSTITSNISKHGLSPATPLTTAQSILSLSHESLAPALSHDGEWLLLINVIGIVGTNYLIVTIDSIVDGWIVSGGAFEASPPKTLGAAVRRRVRQIHKRSSLVADILVNFPAVLLLGPGYALARYLERREFLADKARLEDGITKRE